MLSATISDFRNDLKSYISQEIDDRETLVINKGKNKGVVVISLEEYNSMQATYHEMNSRKNQQRLGKGIALLNSGKGEFKNLIEE